MNDLAPSKLAAASPGLRIGSRRGIIDSPRHNLVRLASFTVVALAAAGVELSSAAEPEKPSSANYEGFVLVRDGSFQMGDVWGDSPWAMGEVPVHEVEVDDFLLGKHEVTVAEFGRFVTATGHRTEAEAAAKRTVRPTKANRLAEFPL